MRVLVIAALMSASIAGLGYTYSQDKPPPIFITASVERGTISSVVRATGTVEAVVSVDVSSQLSGRMADVFGNFNDNVKSGQPIAQIDREIYVARVSEAKAALKVAAAMAKVQEAALARAALMIADALTARKLTEAQRAATKAKQDEFDREFLRKIELMRRGAATERELGQVRAQRDAGAADLRASAEQIQMKEEAITIAQAEERMAAANVENAQAIVEQRQAALDQAQLDLDRTVLRAPIDGVIIKRDVNPGQTVAVSLEAKTLFKIANDLREMEVHGKIDEADIGQVKVGQRASFTVDAYPDRTFSGTVLQIRKSPEVVQNVVTYTVIVSAPNPDLLLLPGMTAQLQIVVTDSGDVLKIPNQALRFQPNDGASGRAQNRTQNAGANATLARVWVAGESGRPLPIRVRTGLSDDNSTQLLDGRLADGQQLIVGVSPSGERPGFFGIRLGF